MMDARVPAIVANSAKCAQYKENEQRSAALRKRREMAMETEEMRAQEKQQLEEERKAKNAADRVREAVAQEEERARLKELDKKLKAEKICNESQEIQLLKKKIEVAKMNQDRSQQIICKMQEKEEIYSQDAKVDQAARLIYLKETESELAQQATYMEKLQEAGKHIKSQMEEKELEKLAVRQENIQHSKELIDAEIDKLKQYLQEGAEERQSKLLQTKHEMNEQLQWKEQAKQDAVNYAKEQDAKIVQYMKEVEKRNQETEERLAEKIMEKKKLYAKIAEDFANRATEKIDFEELLNQYWFQEAEYKAAQMEKEYLLKQEEQKSQMIEAYRGQMHDKEAQRRKEIAEEAEYKAVLLERYKVEENLELYNENKRRSKLLEHGKIVQVQLDERRNKMEVEREKEIAHFRLLQEEDAAIKKLIEDEKRKIIENFGGAQLLALYTNSKVE